MPEGSRPPLEWVEQNLRWAARTRQLSRRARSAEAKHALAAAARGFEKVAREIDDHIGRLKKSLAQSKRLLDAVASAQHRQDQRAGGTQRQ